MGLLSTVVSKPVFNLECVFCQIYSLKFKMTQNSKQGVKSDSGLTPLIFSAGPTKMPLQSDNSIKSLCPLKSIITNIHICTVE